MLKDVTCDQFLGMDESQQDDIVYWMSGIATAASKKEEARAKFTGGQKKD